MTSTPTLPPRADEEPLVSLSGPTAWERARRRLHLEDPVVGWSASIGLFVFALFLRLWKLGTPKAFEFDETYYAKDAWSLLHFGYARNYLDGANDQILAGHTTDQWRQDPEMVVHPEVGKWLIAAGEKAFGMDPFGWRVASAVVGSLMILVMVRFVRRISGSTALGLVGGFLLSLDGLQFVLSRLALLDIFQAFFILLGTHCIVADRDWMRSKLARLVPEQITDSSSYGPVRALLWRPWLLMSGIWWGLAIGTKWSAMYTLAAFGVMVWLWSAGARRSFGVSWATLRSVLTDGIPAFVYLVVVAGLVYTVSWTGWLVHADAYEKSLSSTQYTQFVKERPCVTTTDADGKTVTTENNLDDSGKRWPTASEPDAHGLGEVIQSLRSLWYYHQDVYTFHTHYLNCSTHNYQSSPSGWMLINRPVGVSVDNYDTGQDGCTAVSANPDVKPCLKQVLLIGTPTIWWGGILALLFAGAMWVGARDWRFGVAVVGTLSTWLPWLQYDTRPIFIFYAVGFLPFVVLALTLAIGKLVGRSRAPSPRRTIGVVVSGSFIVLTVLNFAWFWPIFTDQLLTHGQWLDRIWFARWI